MSAPVCPVCSQPILLEDMDCELWPSTSKLGPVHQRCQAEAAATYNEWLDEQREDDAREANGRERGCDQ